MGFFHGSEGVIDLLPPGNLFILPKAKHKVGIVLRSIEPTPNLFVLIFNGLQKGRCHIGIHVNWIMNGDGTPVSVIAQVTLPKDTRILRNHIDLPIAHVDQGLEADRLRGKSNQLLRPRLLDHLPKSSREGKNPREGGRLPDIIGIERHGLEGAAQGLFRRQKTIS